METSPNAKERRHTFHVADLLAESRVDTIRVEVGQLVDELRNGALLVDIRPVAQREHDGALPGAIVIDRNVLEWRLDPASGYQIPQASYDARVIVVCNEGYASSLAAHTLRRLGVCRATDLVGGFQAVLAAGTLPGLRVVSVELPALRGS